MLESLEGAGFNFVAFCASEESNALGARVWHKIVAAWLYGCWLTYVSYLEGRIPTHVCFKHDFVRVQLEVSFKEKLDPLRSYSA